MARHPPRTFLRFSDGDVEIHFSKTDEKFVLHSHVLALHSSWFKASLSERWNSTNQATLVNGKSHWVYELRFDKESTICMLMRQAKSDASRSSETEFIEGSQYEMPEDATEAEKDLNKKRVECIQAHRDLFGTLYHVLPSFDQPTFEGMRSAIQAIAKTAEIYGSEHVAKVYLDSHLSAHREEMLELCSKSPVIMLEFATALKSYYYFKEAATHLIGRSDRFFSAAQPQLKELDLDTLLNQKRDEFVAKLKDCDFALLRMQPRTQAYSGSMNHAIGFFRQWFIDRLKSGQGSNLRPSYAQVYYAIAKKGFSLADQPQANDVGRYLSQFNANILHNIEVEYLQRELDSVFIDAAEIIKTIMVDNTVRGVKKEVHSWRSQTRSFRGRRDRVASTSRIIGLLA